MRKSVLILLDMDTAVLDKQGEPADHLVAFLEDLKKNNISVAVVSAQSHQSISNRLRDAGLDIYFNEKSRFSYPDLLESGEIVAPLPDPYFYQYCAQEMDTYFERTISITGSNAMISCCKEGGMMTIGYEKSSQSTSMMLAGADAITPHYKSFIENINGVIYWLDRDDHHGFHIPEPETSSPKPR